MHEAARQAVNDLRAHKLRSLLTMFGIAWGIISVVILAATGEGFRQGNEQVLQQLGKNIALVFGNRTTLQAGGERAGRRIFLTEDDARAIAAESPLVAVLSPELDRNGVSVTSAYNAASVRVTGVEPGYQDIRTIELEYGRHLSWADEDQAARVALVGHDVADQLFGKRHILGERLSMNGQPYAVIGKLRKKEQDSSYNGPDNSKIIVPFAAMRRDLPRLNAPVGAISNIVVSPHQAVVDALPRSLERRTGRIEDIDWPLEQSIRTIVARRHRFDPNDREAVNVWDTSLESMLFGRMVDRMRQFFSLVGLVTLGLGGIGVMNIMLIAVRERTREIGLRKALGATTGSIQRQFFLEGFFLTVASGSLGLVVALGLCALVNLAPMPARFSGMIVSWQTGVLSVAVLVLVGILASAYPARRAAELPPADALRFET